MRRLTVSGGVAAMAEEEGFEPPVPFGTAVFKTAALNHSATPPEKTSVTANNWTKNPVSATL